MYSVKSKVLIGIAALERQTQYFRIAALVQSIKVMYWIIRLVLQQEQLCYWSAFTYLQA